MRREAALALLIRGPSSLAREEWVPDLRRVISMPRRVRDTRGLRLTILCARLVICPSCLRVARILLVTSGKSFLTLADCACLFGCLNKTFGGAKFGWQKFLAGLEQVLTRLD
jgi:hypothetical protein